MLDLLPPQFLLAIREQAHLIRETLLLAEDDIPLLMHLRMLHFAGQGGLKRALSEDLLSLCHHASVSSSAQAGHSSRHDSWRASGYHESLLGHVLLASVIVCPYRSVQLPIL